MSTRSKRKQSVISPQGLAKVKQQEFFFVSSFVRLLAYAWTMILCLDCDDPYAAGLTSFLCFAYCFVLMLMLMLTCEPGFNFGFYLVINGCFFLQTCIAK